MEVVRLGDICKNLDNKRIPLNSVERNKKFKKGLYPYIGANNIVGYIDEYIFDEKILCIAEDGGSWGLGEQCAKIYSGKTWVNNHAHVLIENGKANLEYLKGYLNATDLNKYITGSTRGKLTKTALENIKILLPSLQEQIRIAGILTQAENLITQRKESILLLDELLKSTFLEMFGDPLGNPKKFPIKKLNEFYISPKEGTKCGPFGSALKKDEYKSEGIPVWVMDNISKNGEFLEKNSLWVDLKKFNDLKSYSVINNDVIISRAGTVGKMCVVKTNQKFSLISTNLIRVRFGENLLPLHFVSLMKYSIERVAKLRTGAEGTFTHMNTGILDNIIFPYPPLKLQNQFASIVKKVDSLKREYQASLTELENMYGVLSQKAFKGELKIKQ